jgi:hypothetical protein
MIGPTKMHPLVRVLIVGSALAGVVGVGWPAWVKIHSNLTAMHSWRRTEAWVTFQGYPAQFYIGNTNQERDEARSRNEVRTAEVDHLLGLSTTGGVPMFQDPADPQRVKPAGFLQMWLFPAAMTGWILVLLAVAAATVYLTRPDSNAGVPLLEAEGIVLRPPPGSWKAPLFWSLLGVGLAVGAYFGREASQISRYSAFIVGSALALTLWGVAGREWTLKLSANGQGVRVSSMLESCYVPWEKVRGVEAQWILFTRHSGKLLKALPSSNRSLNCYGFVDEGGNTLLCFSRDLVPGEARDRLFQLCEARTGAQLRDFEEGL